MLWSNISMPGLSFFPLPVSLPCLLALPWTSVPWTRTPRTRLLTYRLIISTPLHRCTFTVGLYDYPVTCPVSLYPRLTYARLYLLDSWLLLYARTIRLGPSAYINLVNPVELGSKPDLVESWLLVLFTVSSLVRHFPQTLVHFWERFSQPLV